MGKNKKRSLLWCTLILCAAILVAQPVLAQERSIKVGAYGGYFKDSFDKHIFPDFTKETGIKVESVAEPTGEAWLVQLEQAAKAGIAPADVNMIAQTPMLRGQKTQLWQVARPEQDPQQQEPAAGLRPQIPGRQGGRHWGGVLVHHPGLQYQSLPNSPNVLG